VKQVPLLDLKAQFAPLREEISKKVQQIMDSQMFVLGAEVEALETEIADYVGAKYAIGCASGTDALILSLAALEVGPDDLVLTSPFSFFSSASCAYKVGARPQFADIDAETFNIDPVKLEEAITPNTRALLPVHLFGQCAEMGPILEIAERHGLAVVEDAAQTLGAACRVGEDQPMVNAGSLGVTGCYSFFPTKNLGGFGDGGMVVTSDAGVAEKLRTLRVHGGQQMYHHWTVGWNSRLDALQAAVLRIKLGHLDEWSRKRAENAEFYARALAETGLLESGRVRLPALIDSSTHIYNQFTLRVEQRDELRAHLNAAKVGCSVYYPIPLHLQECFSELGYREGDFPVAEQACKEVLSLPIFPELTEDDLSRVVEAIAGFYA
jgi:dTDP-4-amino-4,6-dideoxygalactose transaminase